MRSPMQRFTGRINMIWERIKTSPATSPAVLFFVAGLVCLVFSESLAEKESVQQVGSSVTQQQVSSRTRQGLQRGLYELAIAFFVAFCLTLTVEKISQRRQEELVEKFMTLVGRKVYAAMAGGDIPDDVATYIANKFVSNPFCDEDLIVTFTLEADEHNSNIFPIGIIKLTTELLFKVKNTSKEPKEYDLSIPLENVLLESVEKRHFKDDKNDPYGDTKVEINGHVEFEYHWKSRGIHGSARTPEEVEQFKYLLEADQILQVRIKLVRLRLVYDTEIWICEKPVKNLTVQVRASEELLVCGTPINPSKEELAFRDQCGEINKYLRGWLLPGHGFILWWRPKEWGTTVDPIEAPSKALVLGGPKSE